MGRGKEEAGQEQLKQGCTIGQRRTGVKVTEKYFFFLKSVDWKVGQYYTAIRNAGVCFMLPLMFSVEKMQLTEVSLLALISR